MAEHANSLSMFNNLPLVDVVEIWGPSPIFSRRAWLLRTTFDDTNLEPLRKKLFSSSTWSSIQSVAPILQHTSCPWAKPEKVSLPPKVQILEAIASFAQFLMSPAKFTHVEHLKLLEFQNNSLLLACHQHEISGKSLKVSSQIIQTCLSYDRINLPAGRRKNLAHKVQNLRKIALICCRNYLTEKILEQAEIRDIPAILIDPGSNLYHLGAGINGRTFMSSMNDTDGYIGARISNDKSQTNNLLKIMGLPAPLEVPVSKNSTDEHLIKAVRKVGGFPCVIKPQCLSGGDGIIANITSFESLKSSLASTSNFSNKSPMLLQNHVEGSDYRINIVDNEITFVIKRSIPVITGNGYDSVRNLLEKHNQTKKALRKKDGCSVEIKFDDPQLIHRLQHAGFGIDSIFPDGFVFAIANTCNVSKGALREEIDIDLIHPVIARQAKSIARLLRLNVCGIDYLTVDISLDPFDCKGVFLEVNAMPEMFGKNRIDSLLDNLFPDQGATGIESIIIIADDITELSEKVLSQLKHFAQQHPEYLISYFFHHHSLMRNQLDVDLLTRLRPFKKPEELLCDKSIHGLILLLTPDLILTKGWPSFGYSSQIVNCVSAPLKPKKLWDNYFSSYSRHSKI